MIDLHCHMLPGVDDGAVTGAESLLMAQIAAESGVTDIALTPHCNVPGRFENYYNPELDARFLHLQQLLYRNGLSLKLHRGMEVFVTPELPRLLDSGAFLTLGGSRYLLVEFAFGEAAWFADDMLRQIVQRGLCPVIAHPERYYFVQDDPRHLLYWADMGYVLQVNKGSFWGLFGRHAAHAAHWCLDCGCLHLISSDAHSPYRRTPRLNDIYELIANIAGPETADLLLCKNPSAILADGTVFPAMAQF